MPNGKKMSSPFASQGRGGGRNRMVPYYDPNQYNDNIAQPRPEPEGMNQCGSDMHWDGTKCVGNTGFRPPDPPPPPTGDNFYQSDPSIPSDYELGIIGPHPFYEPPAQPDPNVPNESQYGQQMQQQQIATQQQQLDLQQQQYSQQQLMQEQIAFEQSQQQSPGLVSPQFSPGVLALDSKVGRRARTSDTTRMDKIGMRRRRRAKSRGQSGGLWTRGRRR